MKALENTEYLVPFIETVFPDMTAKDHGSPTGITITWRAPRDQVLHKLSHYHVTYKTVRQAGQPVLNSSRVSLIVSANSTQLPLDDLQTYTTYKIKVESIGLDGKVLNSKVFSAGLSVSLNQIATDILELLRGSSQLKIPKTLFFFFFETA